MKAVFSQFLGGDVELSKERFLHIQERHPGTLPDYELELEKTIANPDLVRQSEKDTSAWLFSKWFLSIRNGRFLIVIIIAESNPQRLWGVTAYTARKITGGIAAWKKP